MAGQAKGGPGFGFCYDFLQLGNDTDFVPADVMASIWVMRMDPRLSSLTPPASMAFDKSLADTVPSHVMA